MHRATDEQSTGKELGTTEVGSALRLLPWQNEPDKPCLLSSDDPGSPLSRVADTMETAQIAVAGGVLADAETVLTNPLSTRAEVEYIGIRLVECLADVLRIAESRRLRKDPSASSSASAPEKSEDADA
ncbi:hypothetical protein [Streptomyces sp. 135]|uniref:hypothetical protein n=1 Tax=Streptomyces sp. 135 TaxID=2838850 RepID=UPI001CBD717B|nr:hypothetical protein [Streptomyces sp. 135]